MLWPGTFFMLAAALSSCPFFTGDDYYTRDVTNAPVDVNSQQYVASMRAAGNTGGFWAASRPVEFINVANASTPMQSVVRKVAYHQFDIAYPWNDSFRIEPLSDAHAIVVNASTCQLYETYDTSFEGGRLSAYSGAHWDLRAPFQPLPAGTPSAMASGLSLYAGMIRWEEISSGRIDHALNWSAPAGTVAQWLFVRPASDTDSLPFKGASGDLQLPYGAHLRLHQSFDASKFGPQSKAIVRALKTYGMYLADTGSDDNALYNAAPLEGPNRWEPEDLAALDAIRITDFDVLTIGRAERVPGH